MITVTCFGSGKGTPGDIPYDLMRKAGYELAIRSVHVVTGGYHGSGMEAPAMGAREAGGIVTGYTYATRAKDANAFLTKEVVVGHDVLPEPNTASMQYTMRLGLLTEYGDGFLVDPSDDTLGTLDEFVHAMTLGQKCWRDHPKPIVFLSKDYDGQVQRFMRNVRIDGRKPSHVLHTRVPERAVDWLITRIKENNAHQ